MKRMVVLTAALIFSATVGKFAAAGDTVDLRKDTTNPIIGDGTPQLHPAKTRSSSVSSDENSGATTSSGKTETASAGKSSFQISQTMASSINLNTSQGDGSDMPGGNELPGATAGGDQSDNSSSSKKPAPDADKNAQNREAIEVKEITNNLLASYGTNGIVSKNKIKSEGEATAYATDIWNDARKGGGGQGDGSADKKLQGYIKFSISSSHGQGDVEVVVYGTKVVVADGGMDKIKKVFRCWLTRQDHDISTKLIRLIGAVAKEAMLEAGVCPCKGIKVILDTGYRNNSFNTIVGGNKNSQHSLGKAADIAVAGVQADKVYAACMKLQAGGCGKFGDKYVHIDVGSPRSWNGGEE